MVGSAGPILIGPAVLEANSTAQACGGGESERLLHFFQRPNKSLSTNRYESKNHCQSPPARLSVERTGIFNFFIVLPEIIAALTFCPMVKNYLGGNLVYAVMAGGVFMLLAAVLAQWVDEKPVPV